ncbi:TonB-dependent receptor plug domain-containing protein [Wenyingzhuangia sp. IMCC45574]
MRATLFFVILLISLNLNSQNNKHWKFTNTPLTTAIDEIQTYYHIQFSFDAALVKEQTITLNYKPINLADLLLFLETYTGYSFKKITDNQYVIVENPNASQLQELAQVVLTGYITSGIDRNSDSSIKVTSKTLGILPGLTQADLAQSIQLIPGISSLDESATGIQIRGGSPDQNLILWNGIKLFNTGYFYGMFSAFNPSATESARIFKSGTSAAYGDRISGIIDITSGNQIPEKITGGFGLDGLAMDAFVKAPINKKTAVYAFARRSYGDVLQTPTYDSYGEKIFTNFGTVTDKNGNILNIETDDDYDYENSEHEFFFNDLNLKVIHKPDENNVLELSGLYSKNRMDFTFTADGETKNDSLNTINKGLSFNWKHKSSNNKQSEEISAYYSNYHSFYNNDEIKDLDNDGFIDDLEEVNDRKNTITELGIQLSSKTQLRENQQLEIGYQLSQTDLGVLLTKIDTEDPTDSEHIEQKESNVKNAVFGEFTQRFNKKGLLIGGLRAVYYNVVDKFYLEPRISGEYNISNTFRVKSALERRNQPISQLVESHQTELRLENNLYRLSNKTDYPMLSSNQVSGGFLYHHKNLTVELDSYYKRLNGLTTYTSGFSNPLANLEKGKSTIKGIDILVKKRWRDYRLWAGYTYNDIEFEFPTLAQQKFPGNNDITHSFRISNTLKVDQWQFSLGWQFRTGEPVTPIDNVENIPDPAPETPGATIPVVTYGDINSHRLPNYHRLDASVIYDFDFNSNLKGQLGISALNLYNRVKPLSYTYRSEIKETGDGGNDKDEIIEQVIHRFSLGFTPNVSLRVWF